MSQTDFEVHMRLRNKTNDDISLNFEICLLEFTWLITFGNIFTSSAFRKCKKKGNDYYALSRFLSEKKNGNCSIPYRISS